jgi:hypothetical protein
MITPTEFVFRIEKAGFSISATETGDLAISPFSKLTVPQREFIRDHKPELIRALTGRAAVLESIAQSIAAECNVTAEAALSILDDDDRQAIANNSDPDDRTRSWRVAVQSLVAQGKLPLAEQSQTEAIIAIINTTVGRHSVQLAVPVQNMGALCAARPAVRFTLREVYGDPPRPGGGVLVGAETQTADDVLEDLRSLYGSRLVTMEVLS